MSRKPFENNQESPLKNAPFNSRVSFQEFRGEDADASKNYVLVGFRPGYPLQAAELNEMQEHQLLQQTLTTTMISNWMSVSADSTYGPGWGRGDVESDKRGLTPISPSMITYVDSTITFEKGWYLVQIPTFSDGSNRFERGNFKVWVYSNQDYTLNTVNNQSTFVGFDIKQNYIGPSSDGGLFDNVVAGDNDIEGAIRYQIEINGLAVTTGSVSGDITAVDGTGTEYPYSIFINSGADQTGRVKYLNGYEILHT